ncbi:MAG TPA: hypothetical protein PLK77_12055 [Pyrinomonadaceae bacterium]|nr:hypothetical protein [Pyrinomonadaceae bacterium]
MTYPRLHFSYPFDEIEWEVTAKGWYGGVTVELEDGNRYEVSFIVPVRLSQDLESQNDLKNKGFASDSFIAAVGMIVVPEITETSIRESIQLLYETGWFKRFTPLP